jgi:hypothetical protein
MPLCLKALHSLLPQLAPLTSLVKIQGAVMQQCENFDSLKFSLQDLRILNPKLTLSAGEVAVEYARRTIRQL